MFISLAKGGTSEWPGANVVKLLKIIYKWDKKARLLVSGKLFSASVLFASIVISYPSGKPHGAPH